MLSVCCTKAFNSPSSSCATQNSGRLSAKIPETHFLCRALTSAEVKSSRDCLGQQEFLRFATRPRAEARFSQEKGGGG